MPKRLSQLAAAIEPLRSFLPLPRKYLRKYCPFTNTECALFGVYFFGWGLLAWAAHLWFTYEINKMGPELTWGFRSQAMNYNLPFFAYILIVLAIIGMALGRWMFGYIPALRPIATGLAEKTWRSCFALTLVLLPLSISHASSIVVGLMTASFIFFAARMVMEGLPDYKPVSARFKIILNLALTVLVFASLIIGGKNWYPIKLPNDYIELTDSVVIPAADGQKSSASISRYDVIDCLDSEDRFYNDKKYTTYDKPKDVLTDNGEKDVPTDKEKADVVALAASSTPTHTHAVCNRDIDFSKLGDIRSSLTHTGAWQSQLGRLLFHHS